MGKLELNKNNSLSLKKGFEKFIRQCEIKDLSKYTISYYQKSYKYFKKYINFKNKNVTDLMAENIDKEMFNDFIYWLKTNHNMNNITINSRLRGIRALFYYLMRNGYMERFKIELLKSEKQIKETYSKNELKRLLTKPDLDKSNFAHYRNWVIVNFLMGTAVRSRTLKNLKIKDINLEEAHVHIRINKNNRHQLLPLSKSLIKILIEYLEYREGDKEDYLFCTIYGKKLKSSSLNTAIRRYNHSKNVQKTSIHMFRHTFAKHWILNGGDAFRLQKILGHSDMKMVRNYVNMYKKDLEKDFNKLNPLEEFKTNGEYIDIGK